MDFAKLTQMSRQAVTEAQSIARRRSNNEVDTWHVLAALLAQENGIVPGMLEKLNIPPSAVHLALERELERLPKVSGAVDTSKVYVTQAVNEVLTRGEEEAGKLKDEYVSVEHLFLGLLDVAKPDALEKLFNSFGIERPKVQGVSKDANALGYFGLAYYAENVDKLKADSTSEEIRTRITQDERDGHALGANRTPTFFINGRPLMRLGYNELREAVQSQLK